jgi:phosphatidylserine/phosphatidylglycerophosphate/cardiolipin synthase-like enzyme
MTKLDCLREILSLRTAARLRHEKLLPSGADSPAGRDLARIEELQAQIDVLDEEGKNPHRPPPPTCSPYFSPPGCEAAVVAAIQAAKTEVLVQAYAFTSVAIAAALKAAKARGLEVQAIMDFRASFEKGCLDAELAAVLPVRLDSKHAIAHNKVMILDGSTVITGSFNFTESAEHHNAENLLVLNFHPGLAAKYRANWWVHWDHSEDWKQHQRTGTALADF